MYFSSRSNAWQPAAYRGRQAEQTVLGSQILAGDIMSSQKLVPAADRGLNMSTVSGGGSNLKYPAYAYAEKADAVSVARIVIRARPPIFVTHRNGGLAR